MAGILLTFFCDFFSWAFVDNQLVSSEKLRTFCAGAQFFLRELTTPVVFGIRLVQRPLLITGGEFG